MNNIIKKILQNTSPAELKYLKNGCIDTAEWLVSHTEQNLTDYQVESVALRLIQYVQNN